jgi:hypothetical protein
MALPGAATCDQAQEARWLCARHVLERLCAHGHWQRLCAHGHWQRLLHMATGSGRSIKTTALDEALTEK